MGIKLTAIEYFDSWTNILEYLDIVELEAAMFFNMNFKYDIYYIPSIDRYKVTTVYENR